MPEVIATFASAQFYRGGSRHQRACVSTGTSFPVPARVRRHLGPALAEARDQSGQDRERWQPARLRQPGRSASSSPTSPPTTTSAHQDWGVIVPYLAQAELIRRLLAGRIGTRRWSG